ncbi:MAG: ABC transporter substrate-binding protein [Pseudomonadota bacterium]
MVLAALAGCGEAPGPRADISIGIGLEPPNLDPTSGAAAAVDEVVYANLFEGLTRIDRDGHVKPALARSWEVSADGLRYVFELAQGVTFHNGVPFTAEIAQFSLERITASGSTNAQQQLFQSIKTITVQGLHRLEITLSQPDPYLLVALGWGDAVMVEPSSVATNASRPVGTGPFEFSRWITGTSITLVRNDAYWGKPAAMEQVIFKVISDAGAAYGAVMAGDVDGIANFGAPELLSQVRRTGRYDVSEGMTEGETVLALNIRRPPFDEVTVRRAIAHAINRQDVIEGALFGYGVPIGSFFSPLHPAYVDLTDQSPHDLDKARALMAQAAIPDDFAPTLLLPPTGYARRGGEVIAAQLRAIGINVKIEAIEWAQWLATVLGQGDYDMTIVSHTEPMDIGFFARPDNYFGYDSPGFRQQLAKRDWAAAQRQLASDQAAVFLFQLAQVGVWHKDLEGYWRNAPIQATDVTALRWRVP